MTERLEAPAAPELTFTPGLLLKTAKNLLFPVQCAGCGRWDTPLCNICAALAVRSVATSLEDSRGFPDLPLFSLGNYEGTLRSIVLAAKHDSSHDLHRFLYQAGVTLGVAAAKHLLSVLETGSNLGLSWRPDGYWVVPAPPSHSRRRKRMEIVPIIAAGVAAGAEALEGNIVAVEALSLKRGQSSQAGRSQKQRRQGRRGSLQLEAVLPAGWAVILVDDVVASGATMREMATALQPSVLAAVALSAAT